MITLLQTELDETSEFGNDMAASVSLELPSIMHAPPTPASVANDPPPSPTVWESPEFVEMLRLEFELQHGQANDTIRRLRRALCLQGALFTQIRPTQTQKDITRSQTLTATTALQIKTLHHYYNITFEHLQAFGKPLPNFQRLTEADIQPIRHNNTQWGFSESQTSWIWTRRPDLNDPDIVPDVLDNWAREGMSQPSIDND